MAFLPQGAGHKEAITNSDASLAHTLQHYNGQCVCVFIPGESVCILQSCFFPGKLCM